MTEHERQHEFRHLNFQGARLFRQRRRAGKQPAAPLPSGSSIAAAEEQPETAVDGFVVWLLGRAGLDASVYRAGPLQRRLPACLRALRVSSPDAAQARVEQQPPMMQVALDSLLLGVTEFYRDPPVFDALRDLLPAVAQPHRPLRIWSASCSVGCELYSVGIVLAELGLQHGCQLLGTDCRAEALHHAQRGCYAEALLRRLAPSLRGRYFDADGSGFRVREPLRSLTRWRQQDVFGDAGDETWDVILWRNTAIYLKSAAARSVWNRLVQSLRPGGLLVTGKAERPDGAAPLKRLAGCIYAKMTS